ncbi:LVIVD repeat-containing protein [Halomarina litorea]|uniref:LVIVD repeat-containing protein n=1 Tax=Halomarina litorea TaxID=2961595 RepID=UPI0020C2D0CF|nr:hypothetical protein [Halomarina sp. BCD28]
MRDVNRRTVLRGLGAAAVGTSLATGPASAAQSSPHGRIELLGHSLLSDPAGGYAESEIRADGRYAALGSYFGTGGSFLVDLSDPANPSQVHRVPSEETVWNADVKFDARDGIYYRSIEPREQGAGGGVEVIDYGYESGSPESPEIVARIDRTSGVHNLDVHPEEPVIYLVNGTDSEGNAVGVSVYDTSDPSSPEQVAAVGPGGYNHDVTFDAERDLVHSAYIAGDQFVGWMAHDVSDPRNPEEVGRFSYADRPDYEEVGTAGFEVCHYARADPNRDLVYVGDEKGQGIPGGKHVLDIGYGSGSLEDPKHLGFTHSPNAKEQVRDEALYDWTTHNHDVVQKGDSTFLVDGAYHEGFVVYDVTDPENPVPAHQYLTIDGEGEAKGPTWTGAAPMAWGANYNAEKDVVVVSDMVTGLFTFRVHDEEAPVESLPEAVDWNGDGTVQRSEVERAVSMWANGETIPNTGVAGDNDHLDWKTVRRLLRESSGN